jgi:4-hydroxyphenylpyruvate dioxygenase
MPEDPQPALACASPAAMRAIAPGARPVLQTTVPIELNIPAINGIGGSLINLVDQYGPRGNRRVRRDDRRTRC